jgi:hypothetical protein
MFYNARGSEGRDPSPPFEVWAAWQSLCDRSLFWTSAVMPV